MTGAHPITQPKKGSRNSSKLRTNASGEVKKCLIGYDSILFDSWEWIPNDRFLYHLPEIAEVGLSTGYGLTLACGSRTRAVLKGLVDGDHLFLVPSGR
jgi:hypothetical protein